MTIVTDKRFAVYPSDSGRCAAQPMVEAADFFHAALLYAERAACGDGSLSVTVVDLETGENRCFLLDLGADNAADG